MSRTLFVAYVTINSLDPASWCMEELDVAMRHAAMRQPRVDLALFVDSEATRDALPERITTTYHCDVLGPAGSHEYWQSIVELAGRAWASLQLAQEVVSSDDHIYCTDNQYVEERYSQQKLLARAREQLVFADTNLQHWLRDEQVRESIVRLAKERRVRITFILTTYAAIRPFSEEGEGHLRESVEEEPDGIVVFNPRWALQVIAKERLTCVIDKCINSAHLLERLYASVGNMTLGDATSLDTMLKGS